MPTTLEQKALERGTYIVDVSFFDEDGVAVVPNAGLTWTLTDTLGVVVNSREDEAITSAATVTIVLSGLDLAVGPGLLGTWRKLTVQGTYDGTLGDNLPIVDEISFDIDELVKPTGIA